MTAVEANATSLAGQRHCPKCARVNVPGAERCAHCHCHLLVYCIRCGQAVFRGESRCPGCREPLRRQHHAADSEEMVQKARRQLARAQRRARWMKIAIFVGAVLGAALVVIKLSNTDFNRLRPVPRDQMNPAEKEKDNIDRRVFEGR